MDSVQNRQFSETPTVSQFEKIVVITQKTALEELVERFNTRAQAKFNVKNQGLSFEGYEGPHETYKASVEFLRKSLPNGVRSQFIERSFLPNFLFGDKDFIVVLGRDGLVVNVAKYLANQPLLAFNPDPRRVDGVLLPFHVDQAQQIVAKVLEGNFATKPVTMAKAMLNNGQTLYAVNDLFIGQRSHVSARYQLQLRGQSEDQSSSGIIVSTGAGSTGWFRSILAGAISVVESFGPRNDLAELRDKFRFDWQSNHLYFSVREPFASKTSGATLVFGRIEQGEDLTIVSQMPQGGVIFSDGIETDYLEFASGSIARVGIAEKKVNLVVSR